MNTPTLLTWSEKDNERSALWRSDQNLPARVVLADDTLTADAAYRLACEGTGLLWRGDFQNARQLLQALARRMRLKKCRQVHQSCIESRDIFDAIRIAMVASRWASSNHLAGTLFTPLCGRTCSLAT